MNALTTVYLYSIKFNRDDDTWCASPFTAVNDAIAKECVIKSLYEIRKEEEFDLKNNPDCLVCLGSFDFAKLKVRGLKSPRTVCYLSDLMQDVAQFEKDGDEND